MASENIINLSVSDFDETVINSDIPVLVDFWASWCGPCKMLLPTMDKLADEYKDKVKVCKVNVDEQGELAIRFGVMTIPTIILFKNGEIVDKVIGAYPKNHFDNMIKKTI